MKQRIISTFILWGTVIGCLAGLGIAGGILLLVLLALLTQWELYRLMERIGWKPYKTLATLLGLLLLIKAISPSSGLFDFDGVLSTIAFSIFLFSLEVIFSSDPHALKYAFLPSLFGLLYVPFLFSFPLTFLKFFQFGDQLLGIALVLWIIIVTKFSDVGGLLVGCKFGKHKLAPNFSPKKTYEGLIGSLIFSNIAGYGFAYCCQHLLIFEKFWPPWVTRYPICAWTVTFTPLKMILVASLLSCIALVSDLVESGFKRLAQQKDSGNTIPGIGGIFDLTDSLILTLPLGVMILKEWILV